MVHDDKQDDIEILLVEDNASDEALTLRVFNWFNIANKVYVVRDGAEALEYIFCTGVYVGRKVENPKVILLDLNLPKIGGVEVLRRIRSDDRTRQVPVVILTSSYEDRDAIETDKLGVNSFIIKPFDINQFNEVARRLGYYRLLLTQQPACVNSCSSEINTQVVGV